MRELLVAAAVLAAALPALAERQFSAYAPPTAKAAVTESLKLSGPPSTVLALEPLPSAAIDAIREDNARPGLRALQVGVVRDLPDVPEATSRAAPWYPVTGGRAAHWTVSAAGATAVRVGLEVTRPVSGLEARFSRADGRGPVHRQALAEAGIHWSAVVEGESARVELFVPEGASAESVRVRLALLGDFIASPLDPRANPLPKDTSGSCQVDVACEAISDPALARTVSSTARLTFVSDRRLGQCTGTLLNATDGSFRPYLYTAAHCVSTAAAAETVTSLWFYENAQCGAGGAAPTGTQVAGGATLLATDTALDGTLLALRSPAPAGAAYAGWDSTPVTAGTPVIGVHHPRGDVKKISHGTALERGTLDYDPVTWQTGGTEVGSSGSGLFTPVASPQRDFLFRGALFGGNSSCPIAAGNKDFYSRLSALWPLVGPYLSPGTMPARNYTALWWNAAEPGWGLNVSHQDTTVFATLFTYAADGRPMWLVASDLREQPDGRFTGELFRATGSRFDTPAWRPADLKAVGAMSLSFSSAEQGTLAYSVNGVAVAKGMTRAAYADPVPSCTLTSTSRAGEGNYQDIWWNAAEPGWGIHITHQGTILFVTLFTYDDAGRDLWLVGSNVSRQPEGGFAGELYQAAGPAFDADPWGPVGLATVGTVRLRFADGEHATLDYTVNGRAVRKDITRMAFAASAPACR